MNELTLSGEKFDLQMKLHFLDDPDAYFISCEIYLKHKMLGEK